MLIKVSQNYLSRVINGSLTSLISFSVAQETTSIKLDASDDHLSGFFRTNFSSVAGEIPFCIISMAMIPSERAKADSVD